MSGVPVNVHDMEQSYTLLRNSDDVKPAGYFKFCQPEISSLMLAAYGVYFRQNSTLLVSVILMPPSVITAPIS